ncbi:MAG TPA: hypothetical protein VMG38_11865 [Trebonia sp.]|nr:hypothetical protein [Trebonia sp.]
MASGQQPWRVLSALPAWQLTQVPRMARHGDEQSPVGRAAGDGSVQRAAELVSAWCRSAPVAMAWVREQAGGPVRVITASPALAAATDNGQDVLTLPAGAWAELAVVAHLTGWDMPRPSPAFAVGLRAMDARLRDCAISHAIDAAVSARIPASAEDRHPRSEEWERVYGQPVPGQTTARQFQLVTRWHARDQRDVQAVTTVIWGIRPRCAIERAVGCPADDSGWPAQLAEMLTAFARTPWPRTLLRHPPPRAQAARKQPADE